MASPPLLQNTLVTLLTFIQTQGSHNLTDFPKSLKFSEPKNLFTNCFPRLARRVENTQTNFSSVTSQTTLQLEACEPTSDNLLPHSGILWKSSQRVMNVDNAWEMNSKARCSQFDFFLHCHKVTIFHWYNIPCQCNFTEVAANWLHLSIPSRVSSLHYEELSEVRSPLIKTNCQKGFSNHYTVSHWVPAFSTDNCSLLLPCTPALHSCTALVTSLHSISELLLCTGHFSEIFSELLYCTDHFPALLPFISPCSRPPCPAAACRLPRLLRWAVTAGRFLPDRPTGRHTDGPVRSRRGAGRESGDMAARCSLAGWGIRLLDTDMHSRYVSLHCCVTVSLLHCETVWIKIAFQQSRSVSQYNSMDVHCIALSLHCITLPLHCITLSLHCITLPLHCITLSLHCITLSLHCITLPLHCITLPLHCITLSLHCITLPLHCITLSLHCITLPLHCITLSLYSATLWVRDWTVHY